MQWIWWRHSKSILLFQRHIFITLGQRDTHVSSELSLIKSKWQLWRRFGYLVLISIDCDNFTSLFTLLFLFQLRRYIKHLRYYITGYANTSNFVKNTVLCIIFSTLEISQWNTISHVWYTASNDDVFYKSFLQVGLR